MLKNGAKCGDHASISPPYWKKKLTLSSSWVSHSNIRPMALAPHLCWRNLIFVTQKRNKYGFSPMFDTMLPTEAFGPSLPLPWGRRPIMDNGVGVFIFKAGNVSLLINSVKVLCSLFILFYMAIPGLEKILSFWAWIHFRQIVTLGIISDVCLKYPKYIFSSQKLFFSFIKSFL